jgi:phosphatidate cytidylyltransferase
MNSEFISRFFTGISLIFFVYLSYQNLTFYLLLLTLCIIISYIELGRFSNNFYKIVLSLKILQLVCFYLILNDLQNYQVVLNIILYNSTSDAIQYIAGKYIGRYKLFKFTSKTLEGYLAGLIFTNLIFYKLSHYYMILNLIGMLGGIISSIIKRYMNTKHYSTLLGAHGGINDRLDSIILPIIYYYTFYS